MFLIYGGDQELVVKGYVDASWDTDPDDSKSQSGYVFILNGGAVSWRSSKQSVVAKSSTEAEYVTASSGARKLQRRPSLSNMASFSNSTPCGVFSAQWRRAQS